MSTSVSLESLMHQPTPLSATVLTESNGFRPAAEVLNLAHPQPYSPLLWQHISHNSLLASLHSVIQPQECPPHSQQELQLATQQPTKPTFQIITPSVKVEEESQPAPYTEGHDDLARQKLAVGIMVRGITTLSEREWMIRYRADKVLRYKAKKEKRSFIKKILYGTRKRVADRRIRYKGKFINEVQAKEMLGLTGREVSFDQLRSRMQEKGMSPQ